MSKGNRSKKVSHVTWAQAVRDIVIAAINQGQLPVLGILGILILVIWRMPENDVSQLMFQVVEHMSNGTLIGYILSVIFAFGWYFNSKKMRAEFTEESQRIGKEKSNLQNSLTDVPFNSSETT